MKMIKHLHIVMLIILVGLLNAGAQVVQDNVPQIQKINYEVIIVTGLPWLFVSLYSLFFLVIPAVNIVALLLKNHRILIGPSV
jgi:hypothetical protein